MSQTSYQSDPADPVAGMIADACGAPTKIESYNATEDFASFGVAAQKVSADDDGIEEVSGGSGTIVGVIVRQLATVNDAPVAEDAVAVMRRGRIYVYVDDDVTPDDTVYVRHTVNTGKTVLGAFRNDNDGGKAQALATSKFLTSASAGGVAVLDINLP